MENTNTDVFFRFIKEDKQFINITSRSICENPKETSGTEEYPLEKPNQTQTLLILLWGFSKS